MADTQVRIEDLVERARAGEDGALDEIVERATPLVRGVARRFLANPTEVDDVVQEVWLSLTEQLDRIESPASTWSWLAQVTKHAAWRAQRRATRAAPSADLQELPSGDDTEETGLHRAEHDQVNRAVRVALGRLRPRDRDLIERLVVDDRPDYRRVAAVVGCPIGSIGPTRQRILARLRREPGIARLRAGVGC